MRLILIALLILVNFTPVCAQPEVDWMRLYGGESIEEFWSHIKTEDGGWAFSGYSGGRNQQNWLLITDEGGEPEFSGVFGINGASGIGRDLLQTENAEYLVVGGMSREGQGDASAFLTDREGEEIWARLYGGDFQDMFEAVAAVKEEQYIMAGHSASFVDTTEDGQIILGGYSGYLVFINNEGDVIWEDAYGGAEDDRLYDVIVVQGGFVAVGLSESLGGQGNPDLWLLRVNEEGEEIWSFGYGNIAEEWGLAVVRTEEDGGFAIAGYEVVPEEVNEDEFTHNPILLKIDENGEEEWIRRIEIDDLHVLISDMARTPDNGYVLVGVSSVDVGNPFNNLAHVVRLNEGGNVMWEQAYGPENGEWVNFESTVIDDDGGITGAGFAYGRDIEGEFQGLFAKLVPVNLPPLIFNPSPEDSIVFVLQNNNQIFSVEGRDPEGQDLTYVWCLDDEVVGNEEMVILEFAELGDFSLQVDVSDEEFTTSASWQICVFSLIEGYSPLDSAFAVALDSLVQFTIETAVDEDSVTVLYTLDDDSIGADLDVEIVFDELGEHFVEANVMVHGSVDSLLWRITVIDPNEVDKYSASLPKKMFHHSFPNPFNDMTAIRFLLPAANRVYVAVYDISGKEVAVLIDKSLTAGEYSLPFKAHSLTAGIYIYRVIASDFTYRGKCVLIK